MSLRTIHWSFWAPISRYSFEAEPFSKQPVIVAVLESSLFFGGSASTLFQAVVRNAVLRLGNDGAELRINPSGDQTRTQ